MQTSDREIASLDNSRTYVITVVLTNVKKQTALEIAEVIQEDIDMEFTHDVGDVIVLTAHMKYSVWSKPVGQKDDATL